MIWTLTNITSAQYDEIYQGTPAMDVKRLFESEPLTDDDAMDGWFPSTLWRINSGIYKIENKEGRLVPFEMNWAQHMVYASFLKHPRLIILKSRQQGISTLWLLLYFDRALVYDNHKYGLMSQGLKESKTLKERIELAYDNLPQQLLDFLDVRVTVRNSNEFALSNDSKIYIATSFRSGTLQGIHISEYGKIANKAPDKARETKTGSLQAIKGGLPAIIESTAEGNKNDFAKMWTQAVDHEGKYAPKDFMPVFLPWMNDPSCVVDIPQSIDKQAAEYFDGLEVELSKPQMWWWISQLREFGGDVQLMGQEYPGTPEEAFEASKDGSYYATIFRPLKKQHVVDGLYDPNLPVMAACDLGMNDLMCFIFFQVFGKEIRVIDEYHNSGEGILHYVNIMKSKPWRVQKLYLPHDAKVTELGTGRSRLSIFRSLGVRCSVIRRTKSVQNDIELVRKALVHIYWDAESTSYLQTAIVNYTKEWNDKLGVFKDKPLHDEWSNPADAIRYMVISQWYRLVMDENRDSDSACIEYEGFAV